MLEIPIRDGLLLAGILFSLGLLGLLVRRNLIFVLMSLEVMLNLGEHAVSMEKAWLAPGIWIGPTVLACLLLVEVAYLVARGGGAHMGAGMVEPKQVGIVLFGPYVIGVELASMLLLAGLVGAYHLGIRTTPRSEIRHARDTHTRWAAPRRDPVLPGTDRPARTP